MKPTSFRLTGAGAGRDRDGRVLASRPGVLLIHGFGGDVSEVAPLAAHLRQRGFTVVTPVLSGHGQGRRALGASGWRDWIASARAGLEALNREADRAVVIGFSMGGLIAVNLALAHPLAGIAALNSPIYCWNKRQILANVLQDLRAGSREHIRHYAASGVKFPLRTLAHFQRLLHATKGRLGAVGCPLFIAQGLLDDTVSPRSAAYLYRHAGSPAKTLRHYPGSGHLICHGPDSEALFRDLEAFLAAL